MSVLPVYLSIYRVYAWCMQRSEEGVKPSLNGIMDGCGLPYGSCELNLNSLQEQQVLALNS